MKRIRTISSLLLLLLFVFSTPSQGQNMAIGEWRIHLPYRQCISTAGNTSKVYAATESGLFVLNRADNSLERINKVNGLSDINIKTIAWNESDQTLLVGYKNANIDIIRGKTIVNIPDIKRASIVGDKTVNSFYCINDLAYVACGFGIVVVDLTRLEVKETYYIGPNGSYLGVNKITSDGTNLFAATDNGVYHASLSDPNLSNFNAWSKYSFLPSGKYNQMVYFRRTQKLLVNWKYPIGVDQEHDTLFVVDPVTQTRSGINAQAPGTYLIRALAEAGDHVYMAESFNIFALDTNYNFYVDQSPSVINIYNYGIPGQNIGPKTTSMFVDAGNSLWIADNNYGLVGMPNQFQAHVYYPNGPGSPDAFAMDLKNDFLAVAPGGKNDAWGNIYNIPGVFTYSNETWSTFNRETNVGFDTLWDFLATAVDPDVPGHVFMGSWGNGVVELNNGVITHIHNQYNSTLVTNGSPDWVGVAGLCFDEDKNLWVTNSSTGSAINVRKPNGTWQAFDFSNVIGTGAIVGSIIVTKDKQKWVVLPGGGGILVFDDNGTLSTTSDDRKKKLGFSTGAGGIAGTQVICLAEDQDGEIWVGTDKGICVFYSPENVFNSSGFDAQQILIEQDGYVQILLETQVVTAIVIDGANRKWIGTESGGVFLMSADGTKQIAHFDSDNSPLLSNTITSIAINQKSGEIFFGTDKGIVSYKGDATEGGDTNGEVYAYPNPVKPDYDGVIAIKGLVKDADVKITDVRGSVIYKTKALGGQATWDGNNFKGERAATGVYLVFITNDDGTETAITKILFIN